LIAVESPLQERLKLLTSVARECELQKLKCYLWSLEDDSLCQLQIIEDKLTLNIVSEYQPIRDKSRQEHYFEVLRFWKTTSLQGLLILEGLFSWITDNPDSLTSSWIKSALINLKLYNRNGNKTAILLGPNATLSSDIALLVPTLTFKVDLPNNGERHEIFKIHLARFDQRFRNGGDAYSEEQWRRLLKETYRCVGAEIGAIVEKAAASTFCLMFGGDKNTHQHSSLPRLEITVSSLLEARQNINPLAIREADKVERMRNRASLQGLPASPIDDSVYSHSNINIFS